MISYLSKYGKYETIAKFKQPSAKSQVPLMWTSPNMEAKSWLLRLRSPFKYDFGGILIILFKKFQDLYRELGLR